LGGDVEGVVRGAEAVFQGVFADACFSFGRARPGAFLGIGAICFNARSGTWGPARFVWCDFFW